MLRQMLKKMAWAGRYLTSSNLPAPRYCEIIEEIALLVCPRIQINMERKEPTIPTAASDSKPSTGILPTIAVSVMDNTGSAIPAIVAGMANLLMDFRFMAVFKRMIVRVIIHSSEMDPRFDWGNKHPLTSHILFAHKSADF